MGFEIKPERLSELIGTIYDCAIAPQRWEAVIDAIRLEFGFASSILSMTTLPAGKMVINVFAGIDARTVAEAVPFGPDTVALWGGADRIQRFPLGEPIIMSQAIDRSARAHSRYVREWLGPRGLIDAVVVGLVRDLTMVGFLGFGRGRNAGDISEAEVAALRLLGPHMRRAAMINNLFELKAVEASTFVSVLDALAAGVVLVDDSLAIVHANGTARDMLGTNDPIVLRRGRIELSHRGAHEALAAAVWQAAQDEAGLGQRGIGIPAPYRDGSPCVVHVLPLRQGTIRPDLMRRAAAALFVAPSSLSPQFPSNALAVLYDLTPAEARVLELLCDGRTQTEIAAHLGIAASTVKTHLQHVFDKTGCRRQVELVKLAGSLAFP